MNITHKSKSATMHISKFHTIISLILFSSCNLISRDEGYNRNIYTGINHTTYLNIGNNIIETENQISAYSEVGTITTNGNSMKYIPSLDYEVIENDIKVTDILQLIKNGATVLNDQLYPYWIPLDYIIKNNYIKNITDTTFNDGKYSVKLIINP